MYETQVTRALTEAQTELATAITGVYFEAGQLVRQLPRARPYLKDALTRLVGALDARLKAEGLGHLLPVMIGDTSGFLKRAALDLLGPTLCAATLAEQGEWSVADRYKQVGLRHALNGAARNVAALAGRPQPETTTDRVWRYLNHILQAHVDYAAEVLNNIAQDRTLLNNAFAVTGTLQRLNFTGSDPHQCARRVILLTFTCGQRVVYKPTDLTFQLLLMGDTTSYTLSSRQHAVLHPFTQSLFTTLEMDLPVMRIIARPPEEGHYGYMQFIAKDEILPRDQHAAYFRKLGKLAAVAAIFGLTDLHEENVMATARGPWLIDAEMGFSYPRGGNDLLSHTCLHRVLNIHPPDYNVLGGCFSPYFDARSGQFEAETLSVPHDADEVNAGFRSAPLGPWVSARPFAADMLAGTQEGVDGVARRCVQASEWFSRQFSVVNPFARLLLNTSDMVQRYASGVSDTLNGTLQTQPQALGGTMTQWLTWFAGHNYAVPGAWYQPHTRQHLHDPSGTQGVTYATAAADGVSVATVQEVRTAVARLNQPMEVVRIKAALRAELQRTLAGGGAIRVPNRAPARAGVASSL